MAAGAVLVARADRRRPEPAIGEDQLAHAATVWHDHLAGRYMADDTPAGERVEAALELLASLAEDPPPDPAEAQQARLAGLLRLAAALPRPA